MPKREDEFWARRREEREGVNRIALCPFCKRGDRLDYSEHYQSWRCGWCEKSFPTPAWGAPLRDKSVELRAPLLYRCPKCGRDSLFKHPKSGLYECLNRDCQAILASTYDVEPARKVVESLHWEAKAGGYVPDDQDKSTEFKPSYERIHKAKKSRRRSARTSARVLRVTRHKMRGRSLLIVVIVSLLSFMALAFGFLRIATWVNWLSLPWIEGWGEIFWGLLPFEIIIILFGFGGVAWVLTQRRGAIVLAFVLAVSSLVIAMATDIPQILFWSGENGERMEELIEPNIFSVTVGANGHRIWLHNNPDARNPTWDELVTFLRSDVTDQQPYDSSSFVCADYAEMLHNNAEKAGIRAAYVVVDIAGEPSGHALNGFNTTDRGFVYIDDTGLREQDYYPCSADKMVTVKIGSQYIPESVFPCPGWYSTWGSIGAVTDVHILW